MTTETKLTSPLTSPKWASADKVELMQKRSQELVQSTKKVAALP